MTAVQRCCIWLVCVGVAGFLTGCRKTKTEEPPAGPTGPPARVFGPPKGFDVDSGPHAAGKKVFAAQNCFRCHNIGDIGAPTMGGPPGSAGGPPLPGQLPGTLPPGGKMRSTRGPDLAHVAKDPEHTVDWLMAHIRNAKTHKPDSAMPPFPESKINDEDLRHLADYLASLK